MYKKISGLVVSLTAVFACAAWAEVPAGYPADYQKTIDAAVKEGKVVIYSTTDTKAAGPLIKGFEAQYPGVKVEYNDMGNDSNLLIVFYVQIMPDDFVMQLHRF